MTQEEKELLIKDLCSRLPYGVKVHAKYTDIGETKEVDGIEVINDFSSALMTSLSNTHRITVGTKIRSKTNPDIILSIISDDCHEDEFECSNGSVLSLKQIEKYYDII